MKTPKSLNALCLQWSSWLKSIPVTMHVHDGDHVQGRHSVYVMYVDLMKADGKETRLYYVGHTADTPKGRAAKHRSSFVNCRISTFVGMSALYSPEVLDGVVAIRMIFQIAFGDLDHMAAKETEKELSTELRLLYGDAVLTRPNGAGQMLSSAI